MDIAIEITEPSALKREFRQTCSLRADSRKPGARELKIRRQQVHFQRDGTVNQEMREMTIEAKVENLDRVNAFVNEFLESIECGIRQQMQIVVAVEELFVNIAHYAYPGKTGFATLQMDLDEAKREFVLTLVDEGIPYDPLAKEDPDVTLPAAERQIGGLGIFMVKKTMDAMEYMYRKSQTGGQNVVTIRKKI